MCGIVGYVGKTKSVKELIKILEKLEYRGYDSSGYASLDDGKIKVQKKCGKISNLFSSVGGAEKTSCFISHTRWATHGKASELNAHPHLSRHKSCAVVHNGIIENFEAIKREYSLFPESETDTAVVAELLEHKQMQNIFECIDAFQEIRGSYAILVILKSQQNKMFLAKQKSPLYVAQNGMGDVLVASDAICFVGFANDYYSLDDGEFAEIESGKIKFFDSTKTQIKKQKAMLGNLFEDAEKGDFSHFMLKEILEEKPALLRQASAYAEKQVLKPFNENFLSVFDEVKFIGCGTAYHAGLMGVKFVQKILGKKASAEISSEFVYSKPNFISKNTLYIFVSQSGETADTLLSLEMVKNKNAISIALTNVLYSSLAKKCDYVLPILAGVEVAVASTKAYVCMLSGVYLFCKFLKSKTDYKEALANIKNLANKITGFDRAKLDEIAAKLKDAKEAVFIGKDMDYVTALEASLKLKEITYINANAYPAGELKHGFLALIEKDTPLIVFASQKELVLKTKSAVHEAESRGATSIIFSNQTDEFSNLVSISESDELLSQLEIIAPMQYLAYKVSVLKNINPDKPRNLAKSVTVE